MSNPTFTIIAGVNGSGKTTFALDYFKNSAVAFINADLIATGLSPNNPDISQFSAGKLMLAEIKKNILNKANFAVETTLASKNYLKIIKQLKQNGWNVELLYLYLPSVELSIQRVVERVKHGGHNIKIADIERRYNGSIGNLMNEYFDVVDKIRCFDNSDERCLVFSKNKDNITVGNETIYNDILRYKNVR
ncbi:hypothetical protein SPONL_2255 [uncultured Candidatus Thioglobus sp.]|nr:hypothetical protein SPONL_2255 [uncultured Candidatus Thioglobus sp.]